MSLWERIVGVLLGPKPPVSEGQRAQASDGPHRKGRGIATLESPEPLFEAQEADAEPEEPNEEDWFAPGIGTLTEPVEMDVPELSTEARVIERLLVQEFEGQNLTLPPMPRVAEGVLKKLRNANCSYTDVAVTIAEDQVAAAAVLRAANSPLYRGMNKIVSLPQAVTRLGTNALRTIMMHQSLRAATFMSGSKGRDFSEVLWRRSLASAYLMNGLSAFTGLNAEDCFVTGLLHDVGNVIVLRTIATQKAFPPSAIDLQTFDYLCHETHQEFGELIAEAWNLPQTLKLLIQDHHSYPDELAPLRRERLQLILTDMLSQMLGFSQPTAYDLLNSRPVCDLNLQNRRDFVRFLRSLPEDLAGQLGWF